MRSGSERAESGPFASAEYDHLEKEKRMFVCAHRWIALRFEGAHSVVHDMSCILSWSLGFDAKIRSLMSAAEGFMRGRLAVGAEAWFRRDQ